MTVGLKDTWSKIEKKDAPKAAAPKAEKKAAEPKAEKAPEGVALIDIAEFGKLKLRTAKVLTAERVETADRLLKLSVDCGEAEPRQIVAGVAAFYAPEAIVGKTIVMVANLQPAVIRGIPSNGMLLAAKAGNTLRLLTTDADIEPGSIVG